MKDELGAIDAAQTPAGEKAAARPAGATPPKGRGHTGKTAEAPKSSPTPRPSRIPPDDDDEEENEGFFKRHGIKIIIAAVVLAIGSWIAFSKPSKPSAPARRSEPPMIMVRPLPPPPPVPTPPPKIIPPKEEIKKDEKVSIPTEKPVEDKPAPPKPVDKPPEGLGTNIKGPGAGMAGLNAGGGNGMLGGTGKGPGGGGSMKAWYEGMVKSKVMEALRSHRKTRAATISGLKCKFLVDATGSVTRIQLLSSTGDASVDEAIKNEVLSKMRFEAPPGGKERSFDMTINARRPK